MRTLWLITIVLIFAVFSGCNEAQQQTSPSVWGQGTLPADWQGFFGNSNNSRLNFVQSQMLNKHANELVQLVDRIEKLEEAQDTPEKRQEPEND